MEHSKPTFKVEVEALQTLRDELKLKTHLAKAELQAEWNLLEDKWQRVEEEIRRGASNAKEPLHEISAQAHELVGELKTAYENIKRQLA